MIPCAWPPTEQCLPWPSCPGQSGCAVIHPGVLLWALPLSCWAPERLQLLCTVLELMLVGCEAASPSEPCVGRRPSVTLNVWVGKPRLRRGLQAPGAKSLAPQSSPSFQGWVRLHDVIGINPGYWLRGHSPACQKHPLFLPALGFYENLLKKFPKPQTQGWKVKWPLVRQCWLLAGFHPA